jgi:hypothetical protein
LRSPNGGGVADDSTVFALVVIGGLGDYSKPGSGELVRFGRSTDCLPYPRWDAVKVGRGFGQEIDEAIGSPVEVREYAAV